MGQRSPLPVQLHRNFFIGEDRPGDLLLIIILIAFLCKSISEEEEEPD